MIARLGHGTPPWPSPLTQPMVVVLGRDAAGRSATAARVLAHLEPTRPWVETSAAPAAAWPFLDRFVPDLEARGGAPLVWVPDLHEAFVNLQGNSTHLVTTQPLYLLQVWADALGRQPGAMLVAAAETAALRRHAAEALEGRGAWRNVAFIEAADDAAPAAAPSTFGLTGLPAAFRSPDPASRLAAAGAALDQARTPAHLVVMASACMEVNDLDNAGALLAEAVVAAPDWAAAQFEHGKFWLRRDDMVQAADAFGRASALMPTFASAAANWGATLGELDRPDEALAAFTRALDSDPANAQAVNNVGVVTRELGRLAESEAAFRRVIALTPGLAFGHYNLGHTLFLQGRYQASLSAYLAGQRNDPARNPVQASRLALARLASGDAAGAVRDLQQCMVNLPRDDRRQLLGDTQAVAWALLSAAPDLRDWRVVGDWLAAELSAS